MEKLTPFEIKSTLELYKNWSINEKGEFSTTITFPTGLAAFNFISELALFSNKINHHPNISNVYKLVNLDIITHSVGYLTQKDLAWVRDVDIIIKKYL